MKHLSYLTPAETILLIDPENANGVEMLKFTFLDLILKNKLKLFERQVKSDLGKILLYKFIKLGDKFDNNKIRPHEKFFFDLFIEKNTNYFIRNYLTTIFNNAKNEKYFKKKVIAEYLDSNLTKDALQAKYAIKAKSTITSPTVARLCIPAVRLCMFPWLCRRYKLSVL